MENNKINFKTLHDGVGFHPFSEGLPYAPQTKTTVQNISPAGAMSTGRPTFSTARQLQQLNIEQIVSKSIEPKSMLHTEPKVEGPGLMRRRAFAFLMDTTLHLAFWTLMNLVGIFGFKMEFDSGIIAQNWISFLLFFSFSQTIFIGMQNMMFENSIGKYFFDLEFKHNSRKVQIRHA